MEKMTFTPGQLYGNDLTIEVISRTAKTVTFKSSFGTKRVKVRDYSEGTESVSFKCWTITASEKFNKAEARKIALENAYYN